MRSFLTSACSALVFVLLTASVASAGTYSVTACFGPENGSWSEWEPSPFATAYTACPGGAFDRRRPASSEGLMVRNVVGRGLAPGGSAAALRFDAPPGTVIAGLDLDVRMLSNPGWEAGIWDATAARWLWCGRSCGTTVDRWLHEELRGLASRRVEALVRCHAARCRRDARHGYIAMRNVRVHLVDGSSPRLGGLRGSLVRAAGAWVSGAGDAAFDASDNSGVRLGRMWLGGRLVHDDARPCDPTRPVPCANGAIGNAFDTRTWPDGGHVLRFEAVDAAGNAASATRVVRVDNTPPREVAPVLAGGDAWSSSRVRRLTLPLPDGQVAPLKRARLRICRVGGACSDFAPALGRGGVVPVEAFAGPGTYSVRAALEDAAGNVAPFSGAVTLRFDDARPGPVDMSVADGWLRGSGSLALAATGARPLSGIRGYRVLVGSSRPAVVASGVALDGVAEGVTPIEVTALSGAGVDGTTVRAALRIDRSRPSVSAEGAPDGWSREPVRLTLRGRDQAALAGMQSLVWQLGAGAPESSAPGDSAVVELGEDGRHTVSYRAVDGAGNSSEPGAVTVKVDRTPPETVAFEAVDPADPRRVRVVAADRMSGVATGRIELRRAGGGWRRVPTTLEGDRFAAALDDAVLPAGPYELRAVVTDVAGNEAVGIARADGSPAAVTLPLRAPTALTVRREGRLLRGRLTAAGGAALGGRQVTLKQRLRGRERWRTVCARRTVVIPRSPSAAATGSSSRSWVRAAGSGARAAGSACALRTDTRGRVDVRVPPGPSRKLRLAFAGDRLLLPAHGDSVIRTRARARLTATPAAVSAGGLVRFRGRLLGGHVPRAGKVVELQARVTAGWRTFATIRSDRRGRVRHARRFAGTSAGRTYRIRLRVRREQAYPFETGYSRPIAVRIL